jgi:phosphoglucosamine mutase
VPRLFGTDGVRGVANRDLTARLALDLATAAARVLGIRGDGSRALAVVGRDPRASGEFLEAAVVSGLASAGVDVRRLGVLPTPAVAHLTAALDADFGVMLSASHNPMPDNGIKLFARGGNKLDDAVEDRIEELTLRPLHEPLPTGSAVGRVIDDQTARQVYVDHLVSALPGRLDGLRLVIDCADGAASDVAPRAFSAAGADVTAIHAEPDGLNINAACGSTHMSSLQAAVVGSGAAAGFAFDGDADRCLAVDADGELVDGDQLLAILAVELQEAGRLKADTVVTTVMSNLGFTLAMRRRAIEVVSTSVGDRYVLEELRAHDFSLGGEQSGHLILCDHATTGDGVLTALLVASRMVGTAAPLSNLAAVMTRLPQVLVNVPVIDRDRAEHDPQVQAAVDEAVTELGESGRVLLRSSGTEPLVRVMVEATTAAVAVDVAHRLAEVVREAWAPS